MERDEVVVTKIADDLNFVSGGDISDGASGVRRDGEDGVGGVIVAVK